MPVDDELRNLISRRTKEAMADPDVRKRLSESKKGKSPWNKGLKGRRVSPSTEFTAEKTRGEKNVNWKGGPPRCPDCGKEKLDYTPRRCDPCYRAFNKGENHYRWKGGTDNALRVKRTSSEYKHWRIQIFRRDFFTCQMNECGYKGKNIEAHHITTVQDNPELIFDLKNGITLCRPCHFLTRYKEKDFARVFTDIVSSKSC